MSNYFKRLPNINYQNLEDLSNPGKTFQNKNLFRRAKLREDIASNMTFFEDYFIQADERPDNVAFKVYGEEDLDWVILITNNILNIQDEWPMPTNLYNEYLLEKYGSYEAIYEVHHYESKVVTNVDGVRVLPGGLEVEENFTFEYYEDTIGKHVTLEDCSSAVTNYVYEERIQEKNRRIRLVQPRFIDGIKKEFKNKMNG